MARLKPLAELIDSCMSEALARQGFAASDVVTAWPEIVGDRLARFSQPIRMDWPKRRKGDDPRAQAEPATLVVRVEGAFALEMQHVAPLILERINAHYGWRCVGRIVTKQGPVRREAKRSTVAPELNAAARERIAAAVDGVEDGHLREALDRFGRAVLAQNRTHTKA